MKKYDTYKNSGIEWIGEIPGHWEVKRGDIIFRLKKNLKRKDELTGFEIYHYSIPSIQEFGQAILEDGKTIDSDKYEILGNEILFSKLNPRKGTVIISSTHDKTAVASTEFVILCPVVDNIKFCFYCVSSEGFKSYISSLVESATKSHQRANPSDIYKGKFPIPPSIQEQTAIAHYLDRKTAEIDELIADKKRLLELYEEEKTAIINQAVTKGINPNVPMKDSGIEWLGEVPWHWEVKKIGHCGKIVRGGSPRPSGDPRYFMGDFIHWITVKEVTNAKEKFVTNTEEFLTEAGSKLSRIIEPEALLLSNSGATLGVPKISKIRGCINDGSVAFPELQPFLSRDFLYYFFVSHTEIYREQMAGNGQPNLNTEIIKSTFIPIPSTIEEQLGIVDFIEMETKKVTAQKNKTEKLINLLTEYRTALISELVTGKVKVIE
jgi:type I restriction enzyme, S subunit